MYEFVNVRFNMDKEDERELFEKLNPKNKGGSIKKILKSYYSMNDEKLDLKSIIEEIVDNQINIREELKFKEKNLSNEIFIKVGGKEGIIKWFLQ